MKESRNNPETNADKDKNKINSLLKMVLNDDWKLTKKSKRSRKSKPKTKSEKEEYVHSLDLFNSISKTTT